MTVAKKNKPKERKSDRPTRKPKQRGKIKKAQQQRRGYCHPKRTELPYEIRVAEESAKIQDNGISPMVAKNVAAWRARKGL